MSRNLSAAEIAAFRNDGVVHVPAAIEQSWLQRLDRVAEQQLANPSSWANDGNPGQTRDRMFTDRYLWQTDPDVRAYVFESPCAKLAAQATGSQAIRFYFDHLLIKEPQTKARTPWHQDIPYWPFKGRQICSIWVALTDATVAGSAMEFVRGSHLNNTYYMPELFNARDNHPSAWQAEGSGEPVPPIEEHRSDYDIVGWDVARGDALIFSAWILHGAPGNQASDRQRAAFSTRWLGDDAVWYPHAGADPTVTADDVSVASGQPPADDSVFPCIWRAQDPN